jgi:hypothetical protein
MKSSNTLFLNVLLSLLLSFLPMSAPRAWSAAPTAETLKEIPEIATQYETTFQPKTAGATPIVSRWRLWRSMREVEVYQVGSKDGEAYALDGAGGVIFFRILHPERTQVFFNAMELRILGHSVDWDRCCSLIGAGFVHENLKLTGEETYLGRTVQRFEGEVDSEKWSVLWSEKDQLAVSVISENAVRVAKTEMKEIFELKDQPWDRLRARGYKTVPYTELADNDTDPEMKLIMRRLGMKCSHKGCGPVCLTPR